MSTTDAPVTQPLQPVAEEKNLLLPLAEEKTSCCGGGACGGN